MRILILDDEKITKLFLPSVISGAYIFSPGDEKKYLSIEAENDAWSAKSNGSINIVDRDTIVSKVKLRNYDYFYLKVANKQSDYLMFCMPTLDESFKKLTVITDKITIGKDPSNSISINVEFLEGKRIIIEKEKDKGKLLVEDETLYVYVNEKRVQSANLKIGDSIFIYGVVIIWLGDFIELNNPVEIVKTNNSFSIFQNNNNIDNTKYDPVDGDIDLTLPVDNYFFHRPRLIQTVEETSVNIDPPPDSQRKEELPWILTMGTSFTMLAFSFVAVLNLVNNISNGTASGLSVFTTAVTTSAMVIGSLVFPSLTRKYNRHRSQQLEKERITKYSAYLNKKNEEIKSILERQTQILRSAKVNVKDCYMFATNGTQNIWSVSMQDDDFLQVRMGTGNIKSDLKIQAPEEHFSLVEDELKTQVYDLVNQSRMLNEVPITYAFTEALVTAIISADPVLTDFIDSILLQLVTYHSPNDLKIVSLLNKNDSIVFNYLKYLPHSFSNDKEMRFFAENITETKNILSHLKKIYDERISKIKNSEDKNANTDHRAFDTFYLILCDNYMNIRDTQIVNEIMNANASVGFSFVIMDKTMQRLPRKCENIISLDRQTGAIIRKTLNDQQLFTPEYDTSIDMRKVGTNLLSIPVMNTDFKSYLPSSISFLEMFKVSKIEQLNVLGNWKNNNPVSTLQAPIGVHTDGETFYLDLHEKFHGPHGLIAGSTGSGKSEFIITYVLSMCLNYHPDEVQFILIDYKGGGLAGAFHNEKTGIKVPHIVGVLTDLDTSDMNRAIVSITSELKRREHAFNEAKVVTGESTIDIYKYQKYYREGLLKTPISHLFIVSDEFAELKSQQPDFMANLISISRIGRSLGVHLILATQKPSGVVNDQIWSNSKFKICLKVSTRSDSMEMLKRPEAASLKETGRFYLQVGYDEFFEIGQSGWSGAKYIPNDRIIKKHDDSIEFIDNLAVSYKTVNDVNKFATQVEYGDQLTNCVKYLTNLADKTNMKAHRLWLEKLPGEILLSSLTEKYRESRKPKPYDIKPIIGLYDRPSIQAQDILELDLLAKNTLIQGTNTSGLDEILKTILFSTCIEHSPEEVNFYLIDMGAETLRMFNKFPQVGDICTIEDGDKILNMLMIGENEIARRKDLFSDYSGDYKTYIENAPEKLPLLVFIINYYDVFQENFGKIAEALNTIFRDGPKYGIEFILTSNAGTIRYKIQEYFQNKLCLQLADREQYRNILGAPRGLVPSNHVGRGLVPVDSEVLEFQTASIAEKNNINTTIKRVSELLSAKYETRAPNVPVVPKIVSLKMVQNSVRNLNSIILGYDIDTKKELAYDMTKTKITPIISTNIKDKINFIYALIEEIKSLPNVKLQIIDAGELIEFGKLNLVEFYNQNFDDVFTRLYNEVTHPIQNLYNVYMIIGAGKLKKKLNQETIKLYNSIFTYVDKLPSAYFLFVDDYDSYKKLQIENWYSKSIDSKNGIWLGTDVGTQIALSFNKLTSDQKRINISDVGFATTSDGQNYVFRKVIVTEDDTDGK